jgi:uncharacterized membrane protein
MTEPQDPSAPPPGAAPARWLKPALIVSVALNLAVAGLVLGAWLGDRGHRGMPRELSFGPFSEAFSDQDRRALRKALMDRAGEFRSSREASRAEFEALLTTLRTEPFDPAAMQAALVAIETRNAERLQLGRSLIETRLVEMSAEERQAFADRLEQRLKGRHKN